MDLAALERQIKYLEQSLDSWESALTWATVGVVVGLIMEYWHEIPEAASQLKSGRKPWKAICIIASRPGIRTWQTGTEVE